MYAPSNSTKFFLVQDLKIGHMSLYIWRSLKYLIQNSNFDNNRSFFNEVKVRYNNDTCQSCSAQNDVKLPKNDFFVKDKTV